MSVSIGSENLHHANLLIGSVESADKYLKLLCRDLGLETSNNPDFLAFRTQTFGIEEARQLKLLSSRKSVGKMKIFFIASRHLTLEAQNALLKVFEDPPADTYFFLVTKEESFIEPTLLSRIKATRLSGAETTAVDEEKFLSSSTRERLLFAKEFLGEEKSIVDFLDRILVILRNHRTHPSVINKIYRLRLVTHDAMPLPRLIIEHLALVL